MYIVYYISLKAENNHFIKVIIYYHLNLIVKRKLTNFICDKFSIYIK